MANSNTRTTLRRIRQQKRKQELGSKTLTPEDEIYIIFGVRVLENPLKNNAFLAGVK